MRYSLAAPVAASCIRCTLCPVGGLDLGDDLCRGIRAERVSGDLVLALDTTLEPLEDAIFGHGDDRRTALRHALADLPEIVVLEALVADLAPDAAAGRAYRGTREDAWREDQSHKTTG